MANGCDMIAGIMHLPEYTVAEGVQLKRVFPADKNRVLAFIREHFSEGWACEAENAIMQPPGKCFIAVEDQKVIGFACYDASAKGFFGPIGVDESQRGRGLGKALLIRTMEAMREHGYAYAVIGWVGPADFYRRNVGAEFIPGGEPKNSIYSNMIDL